MTNCIVCKKETQKYKCTVCTKFYCSLDCYKQHKDTPECIASKTTKHETIDTNPSQPKRTFPYTTDDTVDPSKLDELKSSQHLLNLLHNPHLRNLLKEMDGAPSAWNAIKVAMMEPLFIEFADECLKIVEPMDEEDLHQDIIMDM